MKTLALTLLLSGFGLSAYAGTTDELQLVSGASTLTIVDNQVNDSNGSAGTVSYSNSNFNGWNISVVSGSSNSPNLSPFGLDLASLTATCSGGPCSAQSLTLTYSDINFGAAVAPGGFMTTFSTTQTGNGTATESAYFSNTNTIFATTSLIGTIGPFSSSSVGAVTGGSSSAVPNYSLTLRQTFVDVGGGSVSFSVDGDVINAVPEPSAIVLMGTLLLLCAFGFRRRFRTA